MTLDKSEEEGRKGSYLHQFQALLEAILLTQTGVITESAMRDIWSV